MLQTTVDTDVVIVGAGPVGLFLANECARRGLRWRLFEARASQSEHSKALAIFPRTLEIFDMAGVVDPFLDAANRVTSVAVIAHGRRLARMPFAPHESPYAFVAMVPQDVTERLLVDHLRRKGGAPEYETSFVSAAQRPDHVSVTLDQRGHRRELTAAFVVGCDGAHSAVRHLLHLPFEGAEYDDLYLLADAETNEALPADELQLCPSESGPVAIFPMSATRRRIVATIEIPEGNAPSLKLVQTILRKRAPAEIEVSRLHWSSYFRVHHRQVAELRVGRFFIAGDAAHIHSPFGGQGMNTGLHDVWNLVWKLDMVLHGRADDRLLETYSTERRPVIRRVIEMTDLLTKVMATPHRLAQILRDAVSPIVENDGKRYFDDSLRGGGIRSRFLLILGYDVGPSTTEAAKQLVQSFGDVVDVRAGAGRGITLVRPDGYVSFSERNHNTIEALKTVRSLLELQTHHALAS